MFFRLYKYNLIRYGRQKIMIFWNLIFPIILGSLFQIAFGNYIEEEIIFHQIPVACVEEEDADENFTALLKGLEEEEMITVQFVEEKEAEELLQEDKVEGIYRNGRKSSSSESGGEIVLVVSDQGMNQSILSTILEKYEQIKAAFVNIGREHPEKIQAAAAQLEEECRYLREGSVLKEPVNIVLDYFYSLLAMNCLMGATAGLMSAMEFKANLTDLAARQVVTGTRRFGILLPNLAAKITIQFVYLVFSLCYLMFALNVPLGSQWGFILLTLFVGDVLGIVFGFFIGVLGKMKYSVKESICVMMMLVSSFFSGLMVAGVMRAMETYVPIFNRINPASLIVKSLYSLNIYDTYERYFQCMGNMLLMILVLGTGAFALVRRERYASV